MRRHLIALLLAYGLGGCAQPVAFVEKHEGGHPKKEGQLAGGLQVGEWTFYYPSGAKKALGHYENDLMDGHWTYWHENGRKEMEGAFVEGRRSGLWRYWYDDGSPRAEGRFDADREVGCWRFWTRGGELTKCGDFQNGKLGGRWTYYDDGGSPNAEGFYLNGKKVGLWTFRDRTGRVVKKSDPLPAGYDLVKEHWPGGKRRREGLLYRGQPAGPWVTWHRSGARRISGGMRDGMPQGMWEAWYKDGERFASGPVERSRMHGEWTTWVAGREQCVELEGIRAPTPAPAEWSDDGLAREEPLEDVIAAWLAEASMPVGEPVLDEVFDAEPLEDASAEEPGAPTLGVYVDFTVDQKRKLDEIVKAYEDGTPLYQRTGNVPSFSMHGGGPTYVERGKAGGGDADAASSILGQRLPITKLRDASGREIDLDAYRGKRNVLLVILRGFDGRVCEYCAGQTLALGRNRPKFESRDTEVMVVYPGRESRLEAFIEAYRAQFDRRPPRFAFLYDPELELVNRLEIGPPEGKIAKPTVLLLDKSGKVAFAYVGTRREDRPSVKKILEEIDRLGEVAVSRAPE